MRTIKQLSFLVCLVWFMIGCSQSTEEAVTQKTNNINAMKINYEEIINFMKKRDSISPQYIEKAKQIGNVNKQEREKSLSMLFSQLNKEAVEQNGYDFDRTIQLIASKTDYTDISPKIFDEVFGIIKPLIGYPEESLRKNIINNETYNLVKSINLNDIRKPNVVTPIFIGGFKEGGFPVCFTKEKAKKMFDAIYIHESSEMYNELIKNCDCLNFKPGPFQNTLPKAKDAKIIDRIKEDIDGKEVEWVVISIVSLNGESQEFWTLSKELGE